MTAENLNQPEGEEVRDDQASADETTSADDQAAAAEERPTISEEELRDLLNSVGATEAPAAPEQPEAEASAEAPAEEAPAAATESEHLEDLRRVTAEYANYRRRTDREKAEQKKQTTASVVKKFLPVFDDLERARKAGDLVEGSAMYVIAGKLNGIIEKMGVEFYGKAGEPFNPQIHEAIAQLPNPEVESETIADVVELGYRIGEIELRPAKVAVFVPAS